MDPDYLIESVIGDENIFRKNLNRPKTFAEVRSLDDVLRIQNEPLLDNMTQINRTHYRLRLPPATTTTSTTETTVVKEPIGNPPNISEDVLKLRMRKIRINQMLATHTSPIPDFKNDGDNPIHITRRFQAIAREIKKYNKPALREVYFDDYDVKRLFREKQQAIALMEQFIYAIKYKMPYVQLLRKKYKDHLKYKIGFCFALLRHLKQQQKLMYTSLDYWHRHWTSLMIHLKIYEKVVRLDVDIKDVCLLIRHLNYLIKIDHNPNYYDSGEYIVKTTEQIHIPDQGYEPPKTSTLSPNASSTTSRTPAVPDGFTIEPAAPTDAPAGPAVPRP